MQEISLESMNDAYFYKWDNKEEQLEDDDDDVENNFIDTRLYICKVQMLYNWKVQNHITMKGIARIEFR